MRRMTKLESSECVSNSTIAELLPYAGEDLRAGTVQKRMSAVRGDGIVQYGQGEKREVFRCVRPHFSVQEASEFSKFTKFRTDKGEK